ncbi:MAG: hypothetical protein F6J93_27470 [Oscillatoria sp. SIO1A7]|nr:hypothetical protein [Oscillatoria sp. SIO1A7]
MPGGLGLSGRFDPLIYRCHRCGDRGYLGGHLLNCAPNQDLTRMAIDLLIFYAIADAQCPMPNPFLTDY